MTELVARALVYGGDWIAECPRPGCSNAEHLFQPRFPGGPREIRQQFFACSYCHFTGPISWPDDQVMEGIAAVLATRPLPHTRNWYPTDHPTAVAAHIPHGQTVRQLLEENAEHGIPCA